MKSVYRYEVPVDDQDHEITCGIVLAVAVKNLDTVEFWTETNSWFYSRHFQVFGTGQVIPDNYVYRGTTQRNLGLVWHLYERR